MKNYIQTSDDISFTLNGRRFVFDAKSFLDKIISTQVGKHCDTFYYYRFKATFKYNSKRKFGPMYVEILTNRLTEDFVEAIEDTTNYAFWTYKLDDNGWDTHEYELYFDKLKMIEQQEDLNLNRAGVINELNKAIEAKKIKEPEIYGDHKLGTFAAVIEVCTDEMNVVREFEDPKRTWYIITSRNKEDKTILDVINSVKANETFYELHEVNEFISTVPDPPSSMTQIERLIYF